MKISLIVPVSRLDRFRECLDSLKRQDVASDSFEVVAVSTQDLSPLSDQQGDFGLILLRADRNHPSAMRNMAVQASHGDILAFIDDDTTLPSHWVGEIARILTENPERIIGGPNVDRRPQFAIALANAVQEHPLLEGLNNHRSQPQAVIAVNAHNIPLSNAAMTRAVFARVGSFNEVANYFMDGSEFLYIAGRLGIPTFLYGSLEIQHDNRPAFLPYLRYKWRARHKIGGNYILFPECYAHAMPVKLVLLSFLGLVGMLAALAVTGGLLTILPWAAAAWLAVLYAAGWRDLRRPRIFALTAPVVFVTQALMYCGFLAGLFQGMLTVGRHLDVIEHKAVRYRVFIEA